MHKGEERRILGGFNLKKAGVVFICFFVLGTAGVGYNLTMQYLKTQRQIEKNLRVIAKGLNEVRYTNAIQDSYIRKHGFAFTDFSKQMEAENLFKLGDFEQKVRQQIGMVKTVALFDRIRVLHVIGKLCEKKHKLSIDEQKNCAALLTQFTDADKEAFEILVQRGVL